LLKSKSLQQERCWRELSSMISCYLETFVSDNVPFYEHRGFQVVDAGAEPQSQVAFWAMKREPHLVQ